MEDITKDVLLGWWVDGFYSRGLNSISFHNNAGNFQKIRKTIEEKIKDFEANGEMCKLFDDSECNALVSFRNLFQPSNNCCHYDFLENALRHFCSSGKASFYSETEKMVFTYPKENINNDAIPDKYKKFIEDISKVMLQKF